MKRTEMLELIESIIGLPRLEPSSSSIAADILTSLEKVGMRPPRLSEEKAYALMSVYYGNYTTNQWDEDFEKDLLAVEALERRKKARLERKLLLGKP
jgi:hypothetical protein